MQSAFVRDCRAFHGGDGGRSESGLMSSRPSSAAPLGWKTMIHGDDESLRCGRRHMYAVEPRRCPFENTMNHVSADFSFIGADGAQRSACSYAGHCGPRFGVHALWLLGWGGGRRNTRVPASHSRGSRLAAWAPGTAAPSRRGPEGSTERSPLCCLFGHTMLREVPCTVGTGGAFRSSCRGPGSALFPSNIHRLVPDDARFGFGQTGYSRGIPNRSAAFPSTPKP